MKAGIVGSPQTGKTTLFRLLTQAKEDASHRSSGQNVGVMDIPDERVLWLSSIFNPERTVFAKLDIVDIHARKGQEFLNSVRNLDALIVVIGAFMDGEGSAASCAFIDDMETEFFVADLASVEGRLERLSSRKAKPVNQMEVPFLEKCKSALDGYVPLRKVDFEPYEKDFLSNFAFYTLKPVIIAVNVSEDSLAGGDYPGKERIEKISASRDYPLVIFSGAVEEEIKSLPEEERLAFLKEYGLSEPGVSRIAKAVFRCLGLISFFTVGEDEVRAWNIREGTTAKEAAGKIHSDLERGFIRAEVVSYEDLRRLGSMKACREKGLLRLEGKDYVVKDGDIITVRFSI
ncbi:MAG TPA: redox-regulated ATPase YchF [Firmicutes bacterium]|nr:redox-regulated ATPase YchF [Candidatus Fermentithermobacillaceae bacterium]